MLAKDGNHIVKTSVQLKRFCSISYYVLSWTGCSDTQLNLCTPYKRKPPTSSRLTRTNAVNKSTLLLTLYRYDYLYLERKSIIYSMMK